MFVKIATIALIAFIARSKGAEEVWDGFSARWAQNIKDGFYTIPEDSESAMDEGWTEIPDVGAPNDLVGLGYKSDPRFVPLFSKSTGEVVGWQVGFPVKDIKDAGVPINYANNPAYTVQNINGEDYYTAAALFKEDKQTDTRQIWLRVNGTFEEYPTKADAVMSETPYLLKQCVTWMGSHFYQVDSTTDCSNIFPWFLLRVRDDIIGIGHQAIGTASDGPNRKWFEDIPPTQIAYTIPDAAPCIGVNILEYGLISFHVWFKKNPVGITCSDRCTAKYDPNAGGKKSEDCPRKRQKRSEGLGNVCTL